MAHLLADAGPFADLVILVGVLGVGVCLVHLTMALRRPRREAQAPTGDREVREEAAGGPAGTYLKVADAYLERGELLKAVPVYRQILTLDPGLVDARLKLAACYHQLGLASEALTQYQAAAYWYEKAGETDASARMRQKVRALEEAVGRDVPLLLRAGDRQARSGAVGEATAAYRQAADTYLERGEFLRAVATYTQILKLDPGLVEVRITLAGLFHQLGLTDEARAQYQAAADWYEEAGDVRARAELVRATVALDPDLAPSGAHPTEPEAGEATAAEAPPRGVAGLVLAAMGLTLGTGLLGLGVNLVHGPRRGAVHPLLLALGLVAVQLAVALVARAIRATRAGREQSPAG